MDDAFKEELKVAVFRDHGVRLADNDPVFTVLLANNALLSQTQTAFKHALDELPGALEEAIKKIVLAVEDSERTVDQLRNEAKGMLSTLTKLEMERTQQKVKEFLTTQAEEALSTAMKSLKETLELADQKAKSIETALGTKRLGMANFVLTAALAASIAFGTAVSAACYYEYHDAKGLVRYYYDLTQRQQTAINSLPTAIKKQVTDQVNSR